MTTTPLSDHLDVIRKALERYRARMMEVETIGWYKDASVTTNEIARIDAALDSLGTQLVNNYYIWWISQDECEEIGEYLDSSVPDYIRSEYLSRFGRPGRGRLWGKIEAGIMWNINKPASRLAEKRGGIVIKAEDVGSIFNLPGFLTDTELNFINDWIKDA